MTATTRSIVLLAALLAPTPTLAQTADPNKLAVSPPAVPKISEEAAGYAVRLQLATERIAELEKALGEKGGTAALSTLASMAGMVLTAQRGALEARLQASGLVADWNTGTVSRASPEAPKP